ncbi:MAG TPA: hypothetical protein ENF41_00995 [Candidatus Bathyarchaeota archaeon]|nr:hypothetical protein [Candidatus Bathyarchaeota archaeon]
MHGIYLLLKMGIRQTKSRKIAKTKAGTKIARSASYLYPHLQDIDREVMCEMGEDMDIGSVCEEVCGDIENIAEEAEQYLEIERKIKEMQALLEKKKSLEKKLKEQEKKTLEEIKERYGLTKEEVERAAQLKMSADDLDIKGKLLAIVEECGAAVTEEYKEVFFKYAEDIHIVHKFEQIPIETLKSIISIETVKQYIMKKEESEKREEIEKTKQHMRTGRLSDKTKYALTYIMRESPSDKEYMRHIKQRFNIATSEANRIRWYLMHKQYVERVQGKLTITKRGIARLSEE